jgi:hypothetical protein
MKLAPCSLLAAAVLIALAGTARAQLINWNTIGNISGPSDIATQGTYVDALQTHGGYDFVAGPTVPISVLNPTTNISTQFNVYTSSGSTAGSPANYFADSTFKITADNDGGSDGSGSDATPYQQVLDQATYAFTPEIGTVTMSGLTSGDLYQVQVWASAGYRPTTFTSGTHVANLNFVLNGTGQYVIGTFKAIGTTQTFTYQNSYPIDVSAGEIDALSLREIPEPSAFVMLFVGLAFLGLCVRRKAKIT